MKDTQPIRLADYRNPDFWIDHVDLDVDLHEEATRVTAHLSLRPHPQCPSGAPLVLNGDGLTLVHLALDGQRLAPEAYSVSPGVLHIFVPPQRPFTLTVQTHLNPTTNSQFMGL